MSLVFFRKCTTNRVFLLILTITILFVNCTLEKTPTPNKSEEKPNSVDKANCDANGLEELPSHGYFPPHMFSTDLKYDQFVVDWYTSYLKAMKEPSLYEQRKFMNAEIYRYLVIFPFSSPIMIHLRRYDDKYLLVEKTVTGNTKANPGVIKEHKERILSGVEWQQCINYLEKVQFWNLTVEQKESIPDDSVKWVLEGVKNGKYHVINRYMPSTELKKCFNYLLKLSESGNSKEIVSDKKRAAK